MRASRNAFVEQLWALHGTDGSGGSVRIVLGETELTRAYLGIAIGRHSALCEKVIPDLSVSRRHLRIGIESGSLLAEDLNSLNGTLIDGEDLTPFDPAPLKAGQMLTLGRVNLTIEQL